MKPKFSRRCAPWKAIRLNGHWHIASDGLETAIATEYKNPAKSEANACLIAAAPELLEACKNFMESWRDLEGDYSETVLEECANKCKAAIAKAEGRESE